MSWHYLPELAAEYLAGICLGGDVFVQSNTTSMQETCCSQDSGTDVCQSSQSGMMCEHSMVNHGEAWLMSYREAFRVKIFHQPERGLESKGQEADSGRKWLELSAKYDRDTHLWKTHRCLFDEDLPQSSVTFPKWGMMQSGVLFRLRTAEHPTSENESGYWPTPRANDAEKRGQIANDKRNGLPAAVLYQEPIGLQRQGSHRFGKMFSTPCARDWKDNGKSPAELHRNSETLATQAGGRLNPTWVEWIMGWPLGWTDCDALETDKFRSWQQQHGVDFSS